MIPYEEANKCGYLRVIRRAVLGVVPGVVRVAMDRNAWKDLLQAVKERKKNKINEIVKLGRLRETEAGCDVEISDEKEGHLIRVKVVSGFLSPLHVWVHEDDLYFRKRGRKGRGDESDRS